MKQKPIDGPLSEAEEALADLAEAWAAYMRTMEPEEQEKYENALTACIPIGRHYSRQRAALGKRLSKR